MNEQLEKLKQEFDKNLNFTGKKLVFNGFITIAVGLLLIWKGTEGSRQIIGQAGTDVLSVRGVISSGTYQEYLDKEYAKPHSIVVTRSVY